MGDIKDRLETLEELFKMCELNDFNISLSFQNLMASVHQHTYNIHQENEFLKAENIELRKKLEDISETLVTHYDKIHRLEIQGNLKLLDNDKHNICFKCYHRIKDCTCK